MAKNSLRIALEMEDRSSVLEQSIFCRNRYSIEYLFRSYRKNKKYRGLIVLFSGIGISHPCPAPSLITNGSK
ncbi:MAG TPA: hypothetical protein VFD91_10210 [Mariniphaga sp.]|nr:hypothetical protein [Mariniphaga sp.]